MLHSRDKRLGIRDAASTHTVTLKRKRQRFHDRHATNWMGSMTHKASRIFVGILALLCTVFLASCGTTTSTPTAAQTGGPGSVSPTVTAKEFYRLGQGDQVRIIVFDEPDLSGDFRVDDGGVISMPLVGGIAAENLTLRQLEEKIAEKLRAGYIRDPRVSAEVANFRPFYIYGEVNQGGEYPYVSGMNVLTAIALAGGHTYRANKDRVFITRANSDETIKVPANEQTLILPGDVIRVPERFF